MKAGAGASRTMYRLFRKFCVNVTMIKDKLNAIRMPGEPARKNAAVITAMIFCLGILLGAFSKWLDSLAVDSAVWWQRLIEVLDLNNFFSDIAVWLLAALVIAVFSRSALRAAWNVFLFFAGMCAAYHLYTVLFSGFNPASYMMIWYGITLISPLPAVLCWYAGGSGAAALLLDIGIMAVFSLACFAVGLFYADCRGILYLLVFVGAAAALYRSPKQLMIFLPAGFLLSFLLSPVWPFR